MIDTFGGAATQCLLAFLSVRSREIAHSRNTNNHVKQLVCTTHLMKSGWRFCSSSFISAFWHSARKWKKIKRKKMLTCCWCRWTKRFMDIDIWLLLTFLPLSWSLWNESLDVKLCSSRVVAVCELDVAALSSGCMVFVLALPPDRIHEAGSFSASQSSPRKNR